MDCSKYEINWFDYAKGNLPAGLMNEMEAHQRSCPLCQQQLKTVSNALELILQQKNVEFDHSFTQNIVNSVVNGQNKTIPLFNNTFGWYIKIAAVFVLGLTVTTGVFLGKNLYKTEQYTTNTQSNFWETELYLTTTEYNDMESILFE